MKLKLMHAVEHWRESGEVGQAIYDAEREVGGAESLDAYDAEIESLQNAVTDAILAAGHEYEWCHRQSVGVGCILQTKDDEASRIFDAAMESCLPSFRADVEREARFLAGLEKSEELAD